MCFSLCCFRLFPPCFLFSLHSLFFFFYPSLFISSTINGLSLLFSFYMLLLRTHTHTHMPTHLHGLQKLGLFVCVLFFFLTILWRTHTYLLHIFIFYWFSVCSVIGHKAPAFFVVVVVRSVVLSLLSLTSVLHFLASEVFLFFFFFFARRHSHTRIKTEY